MRGVNVNLYLRRADSGIITARLGLNPAMDCRFVLPTPHLVTSIDTWRMDFTGWCEMYT
ncbi:MAG: hypothetical protein GY916_05910 [Gammaproteobacteria bacterium]|nr:hypothetical protein [Gammaproteobacteria bacterium]